MSTKNKKKHIKQRAHSVLRKQVKKLLKILCRRFKIIIYTFLKESPKTLLVCIVAIIVSIVIGILTWRSLNYANAFFDSFGYILTGGIIIEVFFVNTAPKKPYKILIPLLLCSLLFNAAIARGFLGDLENNKTEIPPQDNYYTPKENLEEFIWEKDIYIFNLDKYMNSTENITQCIRQLISQYTQKYVYKTLILDDKTVEELNAGKYGKLISEANGYAEDYANSKMKKVKIAALEGEIDSRVLANQEYEKFDNLKILGDLHIKKIDLEGLSFTDPVVEKELKTAIECYIMALPLAYADINASDRNISEIWKSLSNAFYRMTMIETLDSAHKERAFAIIEICSENF